MIPLWIANCFLMKYSTRTQRQVRTYGSRPLDKSRDPEGPQKGRRDGYLPLRPLLSPVPGGRTTRRPMGKAAAEG